jgi:hypothetical protein
MYYLELLRASEGTLSCWSRLHLQSLAPTNSHWARVVGFGPLSLYVIHKEGLCPSSVDINRLMMVTLIFLILPTHCVSCVARINSGIPPIDNEQRSSLSARES